jgi:hypothetical protein
MYITLKSIEKGKVGKLTYGIRAGVAGDLAPAATLGNSPAAAPVVFARAQAGLVPSPVVMLAASRLDSLLLLSSSSCVSPDRTRFVVLVHPIAALAVCFCKELPKSASLPVHHLLSVLVLLSVVACSLYCSASG